MQFWGRFHTPAAATPDTQRHRSACLVRSLAGCDKSRRTTGSKRAWRRWSLMHGTRNTIQRQVSSTCTIGRVVLRCSLLKRGARSLSAPWISMISCNASFNQQLSGAAEMAASAGDDTPVVITVAESPASVHSYVRRATWCSGRKCTAGSILQER